MSACYHVCPNNTNFQFDTAFMYAISMLILLKIYQTRHPDINANAYTAFGILAFIIFVGVIGVLYGDGNWYFWVFFTILHCTSCFVLSFQVSIRFLWIWEIFCMKRNFVFSRSITSDVGAWIEAFSNEFGYVFSMISKLWEVANGQLWNPCTWTDWYYYWSWTLSIGVCLDMESFTCQPMAQILPPFYLPFLWVMWCYTPCSTLSWN